MTSFTRFKFTLMLTHACALRCLYCYAGAKSARHMLTEIVQTAIRRALASLTPEGTLEWGFFGGEPMLRASDIAAALAFAHAVAGARQIRFHLTTSGSVTTPEALHLLTHPDLRIAVSCDGPPAIHYRFRPEADGAASYPAAAAAIHRLIAVGKEFPVVLVVRPETVAVYCLRHCSICIVWGCGRRQGLKPSNDPWNLFHPLATCPQGRSLEPYSPPARRIPCAGKPLCTRCRHEGSPSCRRNTDGCSSSRYQTRGHT